MYPAGLNTSSFSCGSLMLFSDETDGTLLQIDTFPQGYSIGSEFINFETKYCINYIMLYYRSDLAYAIYDIPKVKTTAEILWSRLRKQRNS